MSLFALPIFSRYLVYNPLSKVLAMVNGAALRELKEGGESAAEGMPELVSALSEIPTDIPPPRKGLPAPLFFGLIPTRACNLHCAYCGFGSSSHSEIMKPSTAIAGVDWMAAYAVKSGRDALDVHFFGGEPLLAFEVVETAVHHVRALAANHGLKPQLEVATNGIYCEAQARFVGDFFQTTVLSLDGFEIEHNRHRPYQGGHGSFQEVLRTAYILRESPTKLCLRVCVAADNVEQLPEITAWFCRQLRPPVIDYETLQPTPQSEQAGLRPPDPYRFAERFLAARRVAREHGTEAVYAAAAIDRARMTFCPVGQDALILHPDGHLSACYLLERDWSLRGLDLRLGELSATGAMKLDDRAIDRARRLIETKPRCRACFCRWSCAGGCHVNQTYPGCPESYNDFCIQTRAITACILLEELGQDFLAGKLSQDRSAMERLTLSPDDRIPNC